MRKIREVLRLRHAHGLSQRAIGDSLRLSTRCGEHVPQPRPSGGAELAAPI